MKTIITILLSILSVGLFAQTTSTYWGLSGDDAFIGECPCKLSFVIGGISIDVDETSNEDCRMIEDKVFTLYELLFVESYQDGSVREVWRSDNDIETSFTYSGDRLNIKTIFIRYDEASIVLEK